MAFNRVIFNKTKVLLFLVAVLIGAAAIAEIQRQWIAFLDSPVGGLKENQVVEVLPGESLRKVVSKLNKSGEKQFVWQWRFFHHFRPEWTKIKAGTFNIEFPATPEQLVSQLQTKQEIQYSFTIVEGFNRYQLVQEISKRMSPMTLQDLNDLVPTDYIHAEGLFLADTYFYNKRQTIEDVLAQAHQALQKFLQQAWQERQSDLPYKTAYEALIMASIIEKETALKSEYRKIAGVFVNRLNKGMRLQTDPTIIYGVWDEYKGDITYKHKRTKTPYNTYRIDGLPPTPIAFVGREAILAALHPEQTDYLYFVANGKGGHKFSTNLKDHNKAVREMLKRNSN